MSLLDPLPSLILSALFLVGLFLFTWRLSVRHDNYSFVDVTWSLSFTPIALWYAIAGGGWMPRRIAIAVLVSAWSLRLGTHLWQRVASHHPKEDPRYAELRKSWKKNLPKAFLGFFMAQGILSWLLMLPVHLITLQTRSSFHALEWAGLALWLLALVGEGISDAQLASFKRQQKDSSGICEKGLWHYSRHPNYFFQSLLWWGLFLMALPAPWGWCAIIAPLAMLHFLLNVTGIPLTEKLSIAKRGDAYRDYQHRTSVFVPWFPKA